MDGFSKFQRHMFTKDSIHLWKILFSESFSGLLRKTQNGCHTGFFAINLRSTGWIFLNICCLNFENLSITSEVMSKRPVSVQLGLTSSSYNNSLCSFLLSLNKCHLKFQNPSYKYSDGTKLLHR